MELLISAALGGLAGIALHLVAEGFNRAYHREAERPSLTDFRPARPQKIVPFLLIILFSAAGTALSLHQFGTSAAFWTSLFFWYFILMLTFIDLEHFLLPDIFTFPLILAGLIQASLEIHLPIKESIIGAIVGFGSLWTINFLFKVIRHKEGMGGGDFKLLAAIGAWIGWFQLPLVVLLASISGTVYALVSNGISREGMSKPFPFGPMLGFSGFIALLYGAEIMQWYGSLITGR